MKSSLLSIILILLLEALPVHGLFFAVPLPVYRVRPGHPVTTTRSPHHDGGKKSTEQKPKHESFGEKPQKKGKKKYDKGKHGNDVWKNENEGSESKKKKGDGKPRNGKNGYYERSEEKASQI